MYRELQPLRAAVSQELKATLFPAVTGLDPNKLLETYLDRPTLYTGVDVADHTFTALDAGLGLHTTATCAALDCVHSTLQSPMTGDPHKITVC